MIFDVISMKRNKVKMAIILFVLLFFIFAGLINIYFESFRYSKVIMIIAIVLFILTNFTPIMLLGDKVIGKLELVESFISFPNAQDDIVKIPLSEIEFCELKFHGFKGEARLTIKGVVFESGINYLTLNTAKQKYKIAFLSRSTKDIDNLTNYIDILKVNNIDCKT